MQDSELQTRSADRADSSHRQVLGTPSAFRGHLPTIGRATQCSQARQRGPSLVPTVFPEHPGEAPRGLSVPGAVPSAQTLGLIVLVVVLVVSNERAAPGRVTQTGTQAGGWQAGTRRARGGRAARAGVLGREAPSPQRLQYLSPGSSRRC